MKTNIIERIISYAKHNYLNQSQLGEKLGADRQLITDWKTGRRKLSIDMLVNVLKILFARLSLLLCLSDILFLFYKLSRFRL